MKIAFITGITGQDGFYLTIFLLQKDYIVHGLVRPRSEIEKSRIIKLNAYKKKPNSLHFHYGDLQDLGTLVNLIKEIKPNEVYNLASQSHVKRSFDMPIYTAEITAVGCLKLLEAIRLNDLCHYTKFYQASSSEMFGYTNDDLIQNDGSFFPRSPYAVSKVAAYWYTKCYRQSYQMFAVNGILFNHESPERGQEFVSQKIVRGVIRIAYGDQTPLLLGNIDTYRDWGHARDYVEAMWLLMQYERPLDMVMGTGNSHTVRQLVVLCFDMVGITIRWEGYGVDLIGVNSVTGSILVKIDPNLFRPNEVYYLKADTSMAWETLNWKAKTTLQDLVNEMMAEECFRVNSNIETNSPFLMPILCEDLMGSKTTKIIKFKDFCEKSILEELKNMCDSILDVFVCYADFSKIPLSKIQNSRKNVTHLEIKSKIAKL